MLTWTIVATPLYHVYNVTSTTGMNPCPDIFCRGKSSEMIVERIDHVSISTITGFTKYLIWLSRFTPPNIYSFLPWIIVEWWALGSIFNSLFFHLNISFSRSKVSENTDPLDLQKNVEMDLSNQNQLKDQESLKNCEPESIFREVYIFWILRFFSAVIF